jgi:cell wall-associated NlpC family hydrolase
MAGHPRHGKPLSGAVRVTWWGAYVGLPYAEAHCWELIRRIYADRLSVDLPSYGEIDARDLVKVARAMQTGAAGDRWRAVETPAEFDVVLMRGRSQVWHVGITTDAAHVLHTEIATGAVRLRLDHPLIRGRVTGYRRYQP